MRSFVCAAARVVLAGLVASCAELAEPAAAPVEAPAWEHVALGPSDADVVGAVDLAAVRADPLFGPIVTKLARDEDVAVLARASQIDLVAAIDRDEEPAWVMVVHGVDGAPQRRDLGSAAASAVVAPDEWILSEGPALERIRRGGAGALPAIAMPPRALVVSRIRGRAIPRPRHPVLGDITEGLEEATMALLGGAHLEVVLRCRYADAASAHHAAAAARLALVAIASRSDAPAALARSLVKVDFDESGDDVSLRVVLSDDLREVLEAYVDASLKDLSRRRGRSD